MKRIELDAMEVDGGFVSLTESTNFSGQHLFYVNADICGEITSKAFHGKNDAIDFFMSFYETYGPAPIEE